MPIKKSAVVKKATPKTVAKGAVVKKTTVKKAVKKVVKKATKKTEKPEVKKVTSKKKTVEKNPVANKKKSSFKETKALVYAADGTSFWVTDGRVLNSLLALNEALNEMEEAVFTHHVTDDKHDFAEWVQVVLADEKCAEELRKTKTPNGACRVVTRHLKTYKI